MASTATEAARPKTPELKPVADVDKNGDVSPDLILASDVKFPDRPPRDAEFVPPDEKRYGMIFDRNGNHIGPGPIQMYLLMVNVDQDTTQAIHAQVLASLYQGPRPMTVWNVNIPPYNPMGRLTHDEPGLAEIYRNADDETRAALLGRARVFFEQMVLPSQRFLFRGHAEQATAFTFSEHRENISLSINVANLPGFVPVRAQQVWDIVDDVYGLLVEWATSSDAEWFLMQYKTHSLVRAMPHEADVLLPPRFVVYDAERFSTTPMIDLDVAGLPIPSDRSDNGADGPEADFYGTNGSSGSSGSSPGCSAGMGASNTRQPPAGSSGAVTASSQQCTTMSNEPMHRHRLTMYRAGPNQICPPRIDHGLDVRSTAMLRGIPRQMTFAALKACVDEVCFGRYDFLYLRANFATGKNVGYAFINFADCTVLLHAFKIMHGKPIAGWEAHVDASVVEMVYADCQGLDSMLDRFRNSAIMQGAYDQKPHAYYTVDDGVDVNGMSLAGVERAFPRPNNLTRLDRSIARTQAEGLFTGNSRHRGRGGSRARTYDRTRGNENLSVRNVSNDLEVKLATYKHHPRNGELLALIERAGY